VGAAPACVTGTMSAARVASSGSARITATASSITSAPGAALRVMISSPAPVPKSGR